MNKAVFMERLSRFHVSPVVVSKYHEIYEQMARAEQISSAELRERVSRIFFAGYLSCGTKLMIADNEITEAKHRGIDTLYRIPILPEANLVNLTTVRRYRPTSGLKSLTIKRIYTAPAEDGTPHLCITDVAAQLSDKEVEMAKAFALRLKDEFVECGYMHLVQAYEFQIELFA